MNEVTLHKVHALIDVSQKIMDAYASCNYPADPTEAAYGRGVKAAFDIVVKEVESLMRTE
jgi:hypothetical protein